jgi:hypothetical protein
MIAAQNGLDHNRRRGSGESLKMIGRVTSKFTIYLSKYYCIKGQNCGGTEKLVLGMRLPSGLRGREKNIQPQDPGTKHPEPGALRVFEVCESGKSGRANELWSEEQTSLRPTRPCNTSRLRLFDFLKVCGNVKHKSTYRVKNIRSLITIVVLHNMHSRVSPCEFYALKMCGYLHKKRFVTLPLNTLFLVFNGELRFYLGEIRTPIWCIRYSE